MTYPTPSLYPPFFPGSESPALRLPLRASIRRYGSRADIAAAESRAGIHHYTASASITPYSSRVKGLD